MSKILLVMLLILPLNAVAGYKKQQICTAQLLTWVDYSTFALERDPNRIEIVSALLTRWNPCQVVNIVGADK